MKEKNNFALVPRPLGALEKTEPGAKRILSGMVADTLELADNKPPRKRVFRVLTCSGEMAIRDSVKVMVQGCLGNGYIVEVTDSHNEKEILELVKQQPFGLIVPLVNNVLTSATGGSRILKAAELFVHLKAQYGMPIIALSGFEPSFDLPELLKQGDVDAFFWAPFKFGEFRSALETCLKVSTPAGTATQPRSTRSPRIVVVDDDDNWLKLMESFIQDWLKDATVLLFQNGHAAWQELLRADPDLLITDIGRPIFTAEDMLPLLAKRNVKYPILIVSGYHDKKAHRRLRESAGPHLNLTFLTKPVVPEELEKCIHTLLAAFMATDNEK